MKTRMILWIIPAVLFAAMIMGNASRAEEVRFDGSTTVVERIMNPGKKAAEAVTKLTLAVTGNSTENGLYDLLKGWCARPWLRSPLTRPLPILR